MGDNMKLEDFFPTYVNYEDRESIYELEGDPFYNSIIYKKEFDDSRARGALSEPRPQRGDLLKHQMFMQRFMSPHTPYDRMLVFHGLGSGKCLGKDTPILMYNGSTCKVQDIKEGDFVMGDDGSPRIVLSTTNGEDELYRVKAHGNENVSNYVVNSSHILTLMPTKPEIYHCGKTTEEDPKKQFFKVYYVDLKDIHVRSKNFPTRKKAEEFVDEINSKNVPIDISMEEYLFLENNTKKFLRGMYATLSFPKREVLIDPYILGYWLCDRNTKGEVFSEIHKEVKPYFREVFDKYGIPFANITKERPFYETDYFKDSLYHYNIYRDKRIPLEYLHNDRETRLQVLAGMLDFDCAINHKPRRYEFIVTSKELALDVYFLIKSIGNIQCNYKPIKAAKQVYYQINVFGASLEEIPFKVEARSKVATELNRTSEENYYPIHVKQLEDGEYYGFEVDGNGRFLLGDFTVTHNSCLLSGVAEYAKHIRSNALSQNKVIILVRNPALKKNMMNELACICTKNIYEPSRTDPKTGEQRSMDTMKKILGKNIAVNYEIMTFTAFSKIIANLSNEQIREIYSNRYILIDEAHNIRVQPQKDVSKNSLNLGNRKSISNYKEIHRCLHNIVGSKVMLLSATPMKDQASEICQVLNLLLSMDQQLDKKTFMEEYFTEVDGKPQFKAGLRKQFKDKYLNGIVSYLRSSTSDIQIKNEGTIDTDRGINFVKTLNIEMEDEQEEVYQKAYKIDAPRSSLNANMEIEDAVDDEGKKDEGGGIWGNARQASMFVSPSGKYGIQRSGQQFAQYEKGEYFLDSEISDYILKDGDSTEAKLRRVKKLSIKFWYLIRDILKYPDEKFFIYCEHVQGGGCILLSAILKLFGFSQAPTISSSGQAEESEGYCPSDKPKDLTNRLSANNKRFITLTGSTVTTSQLDVLVNDIFNSKSNLNGEYIRVIIGSDIVSEGISFKHIRRMYVVTPYWNDSTTSQAIGRAIRYKSHIDLPEEKRNISIFRLAAVPFEETDDIKSIDIEMYKLSEYKDIRIKQIERLLKENAVDCSLNKGRNVLPTDEPNSKLCDYQSDCDYQCDYVDSKLAKADWIGTRITDTYNLYFAETEIKQIQDAIANAFIYKFAYLFQELLDRILDTIKDIPTIVLARALNDMIVNNKFVTNRYGFINYIREDNGLFFLIDNPLHPQVYTSYYYAKHISLNQKLGNFEDALIKMEYEKIPFILEQLIKNQKNPDVLKQIFKKLSPEIIEHIISSFYIAYMSKVNVNKELQSFIIDKFSSYFKQQPSGLMFTFNPDKPKLLKQINNQYMWVDATEEDIQEVEQQRGDKVTMLRDNPLGYYGVITNNEKDDPKSLKIVEVKERISHTGKTDKRLEKQGTACGSGNFALS